MPCQVKNKRGMLQWTRDGFGLGVERNLTGFDRYHMSGYDEEGKMITHTVRPHSTLSLCPRKT